MTVSDDLVVRSQPWVGDDSEMYRPWLPLGTELTVLGGPVVGSGYAWYQVAPVSFEGLSGPGYGWVAAAGKDGEPWIALSTAAREPPGVELAQADVARAKASFADAKTAAASITAFGLDLFRALLADPELSLAEKNVVFSPTSIALALAMARAGAKGETASQMDAVLHTSGWDALGTGAQRPEPGARLAGGAVAGLHAGEHEVGPARPADRQHRLRPARLEDRAALPRADRRDLRVRPPARRLQGRPRGRPEGDQRLGQRPDGEADPGAPAGPADLDS